MGVKRVLVTGAAGFTGKYLCLELTRRGLDVIPLVADLTRREDVISQIVEANADSIVHLGAISSTDAKDVGLTYLTNVEGTVNILEGALQQAHPTRHVILASSAAVYGNAYEGELKEALVPRPASHYGCSKLAMECLAWQYIPTLPITIVRPFNYTGVGHSTNFLIPKIVDAYKKGDRQISLGNLQVSREFNDVREIVRAYCELVSSEPVRGVLNLCSGHSESLQDVIRYMNDIAGYRMEVLSDERFIRANEIADLSGCNEKWISHVGPIASPDLGTTLKWMFETADKSQPRYS